MNNEERKRKKRCTICELIKYRRNFVICSKCSEVLQFSAIENDRRIQLNKHNELLRELYLFLDNRERKQMLKIFKGKWKYE